MGKIFNPSSLSTTFRYFQQMSLTFSIGFNKLPSSLSKFATAIAGFFKDIMSYIPQIPDFDVRVKYVCLAVVVPILLDLLLVWFSGDLFYNIYHMVDILSLFVLFYEIALIVSSGGDAEIATYILIPLAAIWLIYRIYLKIVKCDQYEKESLGNVIDQLKEYYMSKIMPSQINAASNEEEIQRILSTVSDSFVLKPIEPQLDNMIFIGVLFVGNIFLLLFGMGYFTPMDRFIGICIIIVSSVLFSILIALFMMIVIPCCRQPFIHFREFMRRYGLKIVLMLLDMLYIPIGSAFLENIRFTDFSCPAGEFFNYPNYTNYFDELTNHGYYCAPCSTTEGKCSALCSGSSHSYSVVSPHLQFFNDVMPSVGPAIAFGGLAFIIGLPILWIYLILENKRIVWSIPAFGKSPDEKWSTLTARLSTPGIFLFYAYRYNVFIWGIILPISKLIIVVFTEISDYYWKNAAWFTLIFHLALFLLNFLFGPYKYRFNNTYDSLTSFSNFLLTFIPVLALFDVHVPDFLSIPISVLLIVLPILALPYNFFFRKAEVEPILDPGYATDEDGNKVESIVDNQELEMSILDLTAIWQVVEMENQQIEGIDSDMPALSGGEYVDETIKIGHDLLLKTFEDMYKSIDLVCDAFTTDELMKILKIAVMIASITAGWFFGYLSGDLMKDRVFC